MSALAKALAAALIVVAAAGRADAFCGFYVSGAGAEMFNNATHVVLMRMGTRTVLSMQNNYQGPPQDFALVVPVPVVLREDSVKTLRADVFAKVDAMSSPRLVEYWEQDPCYVEPPYEHMLPMSAPTMVMESGSAAGGGYGVTIEAQFTVGEYQIVILSAKESTGLDRWLRDTGYKIPPFAEPLLRPYVESGSKFFVARVDPKKVRFEKGQAMLSPLRFHYDSDEFALPIRLGLANSRGVQDLVVNVLAPNQRYEVANYRNVTIPTNLDVTDEVRRRFGEFYAALFDRTVEMNPRAVVTEYAWDASSCDPCPGPTLDGDDMATLGADVLAGGAGRAAPYQGGFVLTRLHARYGASGAPDDLVFKAAPPIVGGRENRGEGGKLEERAEPSSMNNFQARYAIRHPWTGPIKCENPVRGRWGGPPAGQEIASGPVAATNTAFAPRGQIALPAMVAQDVPELKLVAGAAEPAAGAPRAATPAGPRSCGCETSGTGRDAAAPLALLALLAWARRRSCS